MIQTNPSYGPPVAQLLRLGKPPRREIALDYSASGIGRESISELIRMATDDALHDSPSDSNLVWAPVHAWRALAELRAEEAIVPLLGLLRRIDEKDDDWASSDLPGVFAKIGPASIVPVTDYLANTAHGEWARVAAAGTLGKIAEAHPKSRAECIGKLCAQLERFPEQSNILNGFLICPLMDLKAKETAPLVERVFAAEKVDEESIGDWEDVQIEFGLKTKREHPRKPNRLTKMRGALLGLHAENELGRTDSFADYNLRPTPFLAPPKVGRNEPCPCGSGKKFKKCCGG